MDPKFGGLLLYERLLEDGKVDGAHHQILAPFTRELRAAIAPNGFDRACDPRTAEW